MAQHKGPAPPLELQHLHRFVSLTQGTWEPDKAIASWKCVDKTFFSIKKNLACGSDTFPQRARSLGRSFCWEKSFRPRVSFLTCKLEHSPEMEDLETQLHVQSLTRQRRN